MSVVGSSVDRTPAGSDYLERAQGLVKLIESEAEEGERTRTVTDKVAHALREAGLPWMMVPKSMGGGGLKVFEAVEVTERIAAADTSAGWILQAYAWGGGLHAGMLPPSGAKRLFLDNKQTICGSFAPPGRGFIVDGGLKITGRWSFGSGAKHADYIGGGVKVYDDSGNVRLNEDGGPDIRFALMRRDEVTLEGNWDVSGLVGTDSQDYSADGVFVPDTMVANISTGVEPNLPDSMYRMGTYTYTVAGHASMALGLMRRALKEIAELSRGKERLGYPVPVDEYPLFLSEFAKHDAMYQTARLYVLDALREAQDCAEQQGSVTPELTGRVRQASTWAHQVAEPVITFARVWAGTKGFREPSALARVGRDVAVAVTHVQVDPITLVDSAPALLDAWRSI